MKRHRTNFEQIPVEVVKKIAKEIEALDGEENVIFESAAAKSGPYAAAAAQSAMPRAAKKSGTRD